MPEAPSMSNLASLRVLPPFAIARPMSSSRFARIAFDIAEHSRCQPGRPSAAMPSGEAQAGSPIFDGFHSTKSTASRL